MFKTMYCLYLPGGIEAPRKTLGMRSLDVVQKNKCSSRQLGILSLLKTKGLNKDCFTRK